MTNLEIQQLSAGRDLSLDTGKVLFFLFPAGGFRKSKPMKSLYIAQEER